METCKFCANNNCMADVGIFFAFFKGSPVHLSIIHHGVVSADLEDTRVGFSAGLSAGKCIAAYRLDRNFIMTEKLRDDSGRVNLKYVAVGNTSVIPVAGPAHYLMRVYQEQGSIRAVIIDPSMEYTYSIKLGPRPACIEVTARG